MELDTVNAYSTVGMEQVSGDPWDCLFGSDSISDVIQGRPEMFHFRACDSNHPDQISWFGPDLDLDGVLTETEEDLVGFNDKSHSSNR